MFAQRNQAPEPLRWPWGNSYEGEFVAITKVVQDRITGKETIVEEKDYQISVTEYDQMRSDRVWAKILGPILTIAGAAGIIVGGLLLNKFINKA